jgi:hypothetical protein
MVLLDDKLGVPLPEKGYADDCRLTPSTLWVCTPFPSPHSLSISSIRIYQQNFKRITNEEKLTERPRRLLRRAHAGVVRQGDDFAGLLVLLGAFFSACFFLSNIFLSRAALCFLFLRVLRFLRFFFRFFGGGGRVFVRRSASPLSPHIRGEELSPHLKEESGLRYRHSFLSPFPFLLFPFLSLSFPWTRIRIRGGGLAHGRRDTPPCRLRSVPHSRCGGWGRRGRTGGRVCGCEGGGWADALRLHPPRTLTCRSAEAFPPLSPCFLSVSLSIFHFIVSLVFYFIVQVVQNKLTCFCTDLEHRVRAGRVQPAAPVAEF